MYYDHIITMACFIFIMYCACISILTYTLLRRMYICMSVYYLNCITIGLMSNICDSTDTSSWTY